MLCAPAFLCKNVKSFRQIISVDMLNINIFSSFYLQLIYSKYCLLYILFWGKKDIVIMIKASCLFSKWKWGRFELVDEQDCRGVGMS